MNKKAFSFVELIIVVSIIILLWVIATTVNSNLKTKTLNTRTTADLDTLENAFSSYATDKSSLPRPSWNTNWFTQDTSYTEQWNSLAFWVYGQVTQDTLPNQYLSFLPLDQFTWAYYAYWKTLNNNQFEVAGVIREEGTASAIVQWSYTAEDWPYNLIREYNWPNFVYDGSLKYMPYNPEELTLNARVYELDFSSYEVGQVFETWDTINVPAWKSMTLYFADGSKSVLGDASAITTLELDELSYPEDDSLISKVSLILHAWVIWTNATQMWNDSEFTIQAWDTTAAVRWTIFGVQANGEVEVVSGEVFVSNNGADTTTLTPDSTDNGTIPSLGDAILNGYGELTETLKAELVAHDQPSHSFTLLINDTFKNDAEYLKATGLNDSSVWI